MVKDKLIHFLLVSMDIFWYYNLRYQDKDNIKLGLVKPQEYFESKTEEELVQICDRFIFENYNKIRRVPKELIPKTLNFDERSYCGIYEVLQGKIKNY